MTEYRRIETSAEVWTVIQARHTNDLEVFSSYSAPDGDMYGDPSQAVMKTSYGLKGANFPLMEAKTTWDAGSLKRENEKHEYFLCIVLGESA